MKFLASGVWLRPQQILRLLTPTTIRSTPGCSVARSALVAVALIVGAATGSAQAQLATGVFSDSDVSYLQQLTMPVLGVQQVTAGAGDSQSQRRELLLMEPRVKDKSAPDTNDADVYIYDYATDEVIHMIVDMNDRKVRKRERVRNLQLPLVEAERTRALDIAFGNEENKRAIGEEFFETTGRTLDSVRQIKYKAFVFLAASVSEQKAQNVRSCGMHRCAKLLLYTADNIALDLSPIIDLSSERVLQITDQERHGG